MELPRSLTLSCALALMIGCTVRPADYAGRACDADHPCVEGRVCLQGVCVAPGSSGGGGGADTDSGVGGGAGGGAGGGLGGGTGGGSGCDPVQEGQPCTASTGTCSNRGTLLCVDGGLRCSVAAPIPGAETCDGQDNDCNGVPDDVSGCVYTLAGDGPGFRDGTSGSARFAYMNQLTPGPDGALYLADGLNNAIRRITVDGGVTTVVGGNPTCGGGDGPIATATLCDPFDIAFDTAGNLYFSEWDGNKLRKLVGGSVVTLAGSGYGSSNGDGLTQAQFRRPTGIKVLANGDLLIADQLNHRIRRFTAATGQVTTVAGTNNGLTEGTRTTMQLNSPMDVVEDAAGTLYVVEEGGDRVRVVPLTGNSSTLAGPLDGSSGYVEGVGTAVRFNDPVQVELDVARQLLYVTDSLNFRVRAVPLNGTSTTFPVVGGTSWGAANGPATQARFQNLWSAARIGTSWYLVDLYNSTIRKATEAASFGQTTVEDFVGIPIASVSDGVGRAAHLWNPDGLTRGADGTFYWAETAAHLLRSWTPDGGVKTLIGDLTTKQSGNTHGALAIARLNDPHDVAFGPDGVLYVAEGGRCGVRAVALSAGTASNFSGPLTGGSCGSAVGSLTQARYSHPAGVTFGKNSAGADVIYVSDQNNRVVKSSVFPGGPVVHFAGTPGVFGTADGPADAGQFAGLDDVEAAPSGLVYIADQRRLRVIDASGNVTTAVPDTGFYIRRLDMEGTVVVLAGERSIARYDPANGSLNVVVSLAYGFRDGPMSTAASGTIYGLVVGPEAYYFIDQDGRSLRRLWR